MNHATMTWSDFYLICFAVGFCLSFFSFVFGGARAGRMHLHFHGHMGGAHLPSAGHVPAAGGHEASALRAGNQGASVSPFNFVTLTAFLAWFGGAGYLLTRYSALWVGFGLLASIASGLIGGGIVFLFLSRVLMSDQEFMDPADYEMVGVLGRIASPIREGGTGELIYTQMGTRRVCGARTDGNGAIAKGTEVVVTRYEKGIAYVRLWSEISGEGENSHADAFEGRKQ
jgi:membrane protein implicated in regulation of membrane protease activity